MSAQKKTKTVNLRIEPETHDLIARVAEVCGKSITAFMTEASVHTAQEELLDERFIGVSAEVFEAASDKLSEYQTHGEQAQPKAVPVGLVSMIYAVALAFIGSLLAELWAHRRKAR